MWLGGDPTSWVDLDWPGFGSGAGFRSRTRNRSELGAVSGSRTRNRPEYYSTDEYTTDNNAEVIVFLALYQANDK